jgi:hypothetical protein
MDPRGRKALKEFGLDVEFVKDAANALNPVQAGAQNPQTSLLPPNFVNAPTINPLMKPPGSQ